MRFSQVVISGAIVLGLCLSPALGFGAEENGVSATSVSATEAPPETQHLIWLGIKTGYSQSVVDGLDEWLVAEGLSKTNQYLVGHGLLGFDLMYELGRIPIGLNTTIHLPLGDTNWRSLIDITLQSGYTIFQRDEINLEALGGIGLAYATLDFGGVPKSFESIAEDFSSPYGRLSAFTLRPSLMLSYTPFRRLDPKKKRRLAYQPIFYLQAGFNYFFGHGWEYGEISNNSVNEENSFSGAPVKMPDIVGSNWFLSLGVAFATQNP